MYVWVKGRGSEWNVGCRRVDWVFLFFFSGERFEELYFVIMCGACIYRVRSGEKG